MGFDRILAELIATWFVSKKSKKETSTIYNPPRISSTAERVFVNSRKKDITKEYIPIDPVIFVNPEEARPPYNKLQELFFEDDLKEVLVYYSRLYENPLSLENRTMLISRLFILCTKWAFEELKELLQNELVYIIDYAHLESQQEKMYQYLAMFLSSECYFTSGELANALKRLYQILEWQEIYDNVDDEDDLDLNGLGRFHESVIANIINIYNLVGLRDKCDDFCRCCSGVIARIKAMANEIKRKNLDNPGMCEFLNNSVSALAPSNEIEGYYFFSYYDETENFFKNSFLGTPGGQALYSIDCLMNPKCDITITNDSYCLDGEKVLKCSSLAFKGHGMMINYEGAIERNREKIRNI